ncbi:MAG TPA: NAD(P)/FAD-dependent oxidoreductase [Solirubrobacteraceae bacterium]
MARRATKRGDERTALDGDYDVLICGASFAGLAVARELAGSGARTLIVDRYDVGERQTSACGIPTSWMRALGIEAAIKQTFSDLVLHTPHGSVRWNLPWTFSTFDYRTICELLREQGADAAFETAKVEGRTGDVVHTDRGDLHAPLIVDALGWRRILGSGENVQPPEAFLSRGLEVHPNASGEDLELWIDRSYVRAGYAWAFPADRELRVGVGSFEPRHHVKDQTVQLADDLGVPAVRYQGNWIPHRLRPAVEDGIFFAGDSAGHCLPTTAEGIRTALYFGLACGRELRAVYEGRASHDEALRRYAEFSAAHAWKFRWLLRVQDWVPRIPPRALTRVLKVLERRRLTAWAFDHYLGIAPPEFVTAAPAPARRPAFVAA